MTRAEALAEAQKRWGEDAWVTRGVNEAGRWEYTVYSFVTAHPETDRRPDHPRGYGDSWQAAFADADRRAK